MSTNNRRQRCINAIVDTLSRVRKNKPSGDSVRELSDRFLSPAGILECGHHELSAAGLTENEAQLLSLIPDLTRYIQRTAFGRHPHLNTLTAASEFLKTLYVGTQIEQFWILCLDSSGRLIECRMLQEGTTEETPFYLAPLLQCIIGNQTYAFVLSHNHPGGTLRPSQADVWCTQETLSALHAVRIPMLDHIIIADGQAVSLRENGYLTPSMWLGQAPECALLRSWLDP